VEILDLRHFSSVDLRPLLDDEARVWANLLSWDYSGSAEMICAMSDAKFFRLRGRHRTRPDFRYTFFVLRRQQGRGRRFFRDQPQTGFPIRARMELKLLTHVIETLQQSTRIPPC